MNEQQLVDQEKGGTIEVTAVTHMKAKNGIQNGYSAERIGTEQLVKA
jgi:hypothetical protein